MTPLKLFVALGALSAASQALAWDYVLLDTDKAAQNWQITSQQLGVKTDKRFQRDPAHFARRSAGRRQHRRHR